jgi:hypothetical protein
VIHHALVWGAVFAAAKLLIYLDNQTTRQPDNQMSEGLQKGTKITLVADTPFAAALVALGVKFTDFSEPCSYSEINGTERVVWGMNPEGVVAPSEFSRISKALKDPEKWFIDNPDHPFGYAYVAVRNYIEMQGLIDRIEPTVRFKLKNGMTFLIKKNSEKYHKLIAKGLKPD